jgi:hypothetical protein
MIIKKINKRAGITDNFGSLVDYLTDTQNKSNRVSEIRITNCDTDNLDFAKLDVLATQRMNQRSKKDKTYHLLISFDEKDRPLSKRELQAIEDKVCKDLGFEKHQRISVFHNDTNNPHLHIAINKVDPKKYTVKDPYWDHLTMAKTASEIETKYNLTSTNHSKKFTVSEVQANDFEKQQGIESFKTYMQRLVPDIKNKNSWSELHSFLATNGIQIKKRANGLVFISNNTRIKASTINRDFSLSKLEKRLGKFEESNTDIVKENWKKESKGYQADVPVQDNDKYHSYLLEKENMKANVNTNLKRSIRNVIDNAKLLKKLVFVQAQNDPAVQEINKLISMLINSSVSSEIQSLVAENRRKTRSMTSFKEYLKEKKYVLEKQNGSHKENRHNFYGSCAFDNICEIKTKSKRFLWNTLPITNNGTTKFNVLQQFFEKTARNLKNDITKQRRITRIANFIFNKIKLRSFSTQRIPKIAIIAQRLRELSQCVVENAKQTISSVLSNNLSGIVQRPKEQSNNSTNVRRSCARH